MSKFKVVGVIPAGRKDRLSIMVKYILRERHVFDQVQLWMNCVGENLDYCMSLCETYPDFFVDVAVKDPLVCPSNLFALPLNVSQFVSNTTDLGTIYLRMDDDIVWFEERALEGLINFRIKNPQYLQVALATLNTTNTNYLFREMGVLPVIPETCTWDWNCPTCLYGVKYPNNTIDSFGKRVDESTVSLDVHNYFLDRVHNKGEVDKFHFERYDCPKNVRIHNQVCAYFGLDYARMMQVRGPKPPSDNLSDRYWDEWAYPLEEYSEKTGFVSTIYGGHLCSHYSFMYAQEELRKSDVLQRYAAIAP